MAALFVVALALVSCGGGGGGDEEAIKEMVAASVSDTGPESCLKYSTVRYLEMTTHREGDAAVEACEGDALDPDADQPTRVEVSTIDVDGNSATAIVAVEGSVVDGQKMRIVFAEREGRWKYDEWLGFVDFDAERFILQVGRDGMLRADSAQEAEAIACVIGGMEEMNDESLERELFEDPEPLSELWGNCNRGSAPT